MAGDMTWLILGRAAKGLGGGGLMIPAQAIIADVVPARTSVLSAGEGVAEWRSAEGAL
jgi:MFS family permease